MENAKITFPKLIVSVCVRKSCEKLEEIAPICCLTKEIVDDPQNRSSYVCHWTSDPYHTVKTRTDAQ